MCLLLVGLGVHRRYPLVIAANRDEFYDRPSATARFWEDQPHILAGRDLQSGGTWLGLTKQGRWAALTNYRDPSSSRPGAPSRGWLVRDFLAGDAGPMAYLETLRPEGHRFEGFNLLVGQGEEVGWMSNRSEGPPRRLGPGIYGLSNGLLDTPWPKVIRGKEGLARLLASHTEVEPERLFELLSDRRPAPDHQLPQTGVGLSWERVLSPLFIVSPTYGTRSCTVILMDHGGDVLFTERSFGPGGLLQETVRYAFTVPTPHTL